MTLVKFFFTKFKFELFSYQVEFKLIRLLVKFLHFKLEFANNWVELSPKLIRLSVNSFFRTRVCKQLSWVSAFNKLSSQILSWLIRRVLLRIPKFVPKMFYQMMWQNCVIDVHTGQPSIFIIRISNSFHLGLFVNKQL